MRLLFLIMLAFSFNLYADTIDHYMNIANNIPQMEMKADPQSQAWARSARNILVLTSESIGESLILANENAKAHGSPPLFCLPPSTHLSPEEINELIQQTYKEATEPEKNKMTVSQIALLGFSKRFPCQAVQNKAASPPATPSLQHVGAS